MNEKTPSNKAIALLDSARVEIESLKNQIEELEKELENYRPASDLVK